MLKKYKPYIIAYYIITAILLIVAAFYDLAIDKALNNPTNPFAIWFYNTGEMPSRLICPLAGTVIFYVGETKLQKITGFILSIGGSAYLGYHIGHYFFVEENNILFGIIYGIGFGIFCLIIGKYINIPDDKKELLLKISILAVIIMFIQIGIIEGSKYLWGRVRFRDLLAMGSYDAFTPWYHLNGINGHKSFPSGHTAGAGISYVMMFLPLISKKWKEHQWLCFAIPFVYSGIVAFTRLVMGAHYLSDVTVGGAVSFTIVIITLYIFEKKKAQA